MKTIIKLTNEYASNLNCLFFNFDGNLASYYKMFHLIFKECIVSDNIDVAKQEHFKIIDIVFIKIDNHPKLKTSHEIRTFIQCLRREQELLPVYLIKNDITDIKVLELIDNCYCLDGVIPTPFNREKVYRFLYRILKRLIVEKDLHAYIETLESQLCDDTKLETLKTPLPITHKKETKRRDQKREKDIRFSQTDKISAIEFMELLDDTVIDKVENIEIELENLVGVVYKLEDVEAPTAVQIVHKDIRPIIEEIFVLVESIGYFGVTARAFGILSNFLSSLSVQEFQNQNNKSMFITMLLAIINDLEKWLQIIFIDHTTKDIHYLDASFSSNILEIEKVFYEEEDDDEEDEDDLEFF